MHEKKFMRIRIDSMKPWLYRTQMLYKKMHFICTIDPIDSHSQSVVFYEHVFVSKKVHFIEVGIPLIKSTNR